MGVETGIRVVDLPSNPDTVEDKITYSFAAGNSSGNAAFIVGLDQHGLVEESTIFSMSWRQEWLEQQLAANPLGAVFVFAHYPAFKISNRTDPLPMLEGLYADTTSRNRFWRSLSDHGVRAYFCTHSHYYDHSRILNKADTNSSSPPIVHQFIVGTAGAPFSHGWNPVTNDAHFVTSNVKHEENRLGYIVVEVDSPWVTMTWKHRTATNVFSDGGDVFRYQYGPGAGAPPLESVRKTDEAALYQNYPNPFNPNSEIRYQISEFRHVKLAVYDLLGREVAVLVNEKKAPGIYQVTFDASSLASGVYFYRLVTGSFVETRKFIVLK